METLEHRLQIRENCQAGHEEGARLLALTPEADRSSLEVAVARRLLNSKGYQHSYEQGVWYEVSRTPLCLVRERIEMRQLNV